MVRPRRQGWQELKPEPEDRGGAPTPKAGQSPYIRGLRETVSNSLYFLFGYLEWAVLTSNKGNL